ncbi:Arylsulfatase [Thalassoglobus neptunius]|uniref:Arylsulfatase n=1 Tax=Thalassoglobus neptunius TaxID=1938619 RepID=A0A5C5X594_9PLAN|nr:sulfatase-like hydrolase/transferase [Thalassoglobus neptunius]TWT57789.1 Arylsulfatase [Thalassoglobus neptunius]
MTPVSLLPTPQLRLALSFFLAGLVIIGSNETKCLAERPNIVLVMADDMGWGQTGYYNHPVLKTPNLDAMASNGLRFDRFYAGAPNCSPTRATVMTGRTNDRTGVLNHGVPLRPQEKTIAQALQSAGYATGHFGKWHLNGYRGAGAPILGDDIRSPGRFGFDHWLSVTNFFDRDPIMSRMGEFEEFEGDSSEIIVDEAVKFIGQQVDESRPFFTVIWYGTPHSPFVASEDDRSAFRYLNEASSNHYGELVAMDRSIGTLRKQLRELGVADNTLFWFCSDNGGLPGIKPGTVGGLRGFKGTVYEGGLRVPAIIEWPSEISSSRITEYPACTMDIFPTISDIVGLPESSRITPQDGVSLKPLIEKEIDRREKPMGFRHTGRSALIDNDWKIVAPKKNSNVYELYNIQSDPKETQNLIEESPEVASRLIQELQQFHESVDQSIAGLDYPEKEVIPADPGPKSWTESDEYQPYIDEWKNRPEYKRYFQKQK